MKTIVLLLLIATTSCKGQGAQEVGATNFVTPNVALPIGEIVPQLSNSILIIYQAANGDYWFGSDVDGVYTYDGRRIIHYSIKDGLCNNTIREIKEDTAGNIFFSTQHGGISKFDGKAFTTLPVIKSDSPGQHWMLNPGDMWFKGETNSGGPYRYDGQHLYQLVFPKHYLAEEYAANEPGHAWSPFDVYYIYKDHQGNIWFGTSNFGVCRYDGKTLSWLYEDHLQFVPEGGSFGIRSILEDHDGKFWFCNTNYRYTIAPGDSTSQGYSFLQYKREKGIDVKSQDGNSQIYFLSILEDRKGDLWMSTYGEGVWRYNGKKMINYPIKDGSRDVTLFSIYQDHRGDLWLGTHENGAFKFNGKGFERFKTLDQK